MTTKVKKAVVRNISSAKGAITDPGIGPHPQPGGGTSPGGSDTSPKVPKTTTTKTIKDK